LDCELVESEATDGDLQLARFSSRSALNRVPPVSIESALFAGPSTDINQEDQLHAITRPSSQVQEISQSTTAF